MTHADAGMSAYSVGPPEPVYEYRVVCAAEVTPPVSCRDYAHAVAVAEGFTSGGTHEHTIECREVGPWEAT